MGEHVLFDERRRHPQHIHVTDSTQASLEVQLRPLTLVANDLFQTKVVIGGCVIDGPLAVVERLADANPERMMIRPSR